MVDAALTAAATAMTNLANSLNQGTEKNLLTVEFFKGDGTQDPERWLKNLEELLLPTIRIMIENLNLHQSI